jgi:hypothetical protein
VGVRVWVPGDGGVRRMGGAGRVVAVRARGGRRGVAAAAWRVRARAAALGTFLGHTTRRAARGGGKRRKRRARTLVFLLELARAVALHEGRLACTHTQEATRGRVSKRRAARGKPRARCRRVRGARPRSVARASGTIGAPRLARRRGASGGHAISVRAARGGGAARPRRGVKAQSPRALAALTSVCGPFVHAGGRDARSMRGAHPFHRRPRAPA